MKKIYEIIHPCGTTKRVQGCSVLPHVDGTTVIYSEVDMLFNNIVAVVPADCLIHLVLQSDINKSTDITDPLYVLREDTYSNEEVNEQTGRMIREQYKRENP